MVATQFVINILGQPITRACDAPVIWVSH